MKPLSLSEKYSILFTPLDGVAPVWISEVDASDWLWVAHMVHAEGGRLIALWGTDGRPEAGQFSISAVFCVVGDLLYLRLPLAISGGVPEAYPDLSTAFPSATRMQRACFDLLGIPVEESKPGQDQRPWINHGRWPRDYFPLRPGQTGLEQFDNGLEAYPFVVVEGEGVHEIAVGPIHAGVIEPGHFRFSVVGEKVMRLEQHLGYVHKGVEKLFTRQKLADGHRLAGRISGDTTVAYAWAYSMAAESVSACTIPVRAQWLRALLLERERIANHLGDLGALGNDAGLALGLAQFSRLKEDWLRLSQRVFGHRMMMDCIRPGGVAGDLAPPDFSAMSVQYDEIEREVRQMQVIYEAHSGLQDRLIGTGRIVPKLAARLDLCGLAGRASGQSFDARDDQEMVPYSQLEVQMATHRNGDVAARVLLRFEEIYESLRLLREIARQIPAGPVNMALPEYNHGGGGFGLGWVEGWRGAILVALETGAQGQILRCHCHDPSWQNWPVLEHAIMGNIVPDFPLINKSFNLSYSGHDL